MTFAEYKSDMNSQRLYEMSFVSFLEKSDYNDTAHFLLWRL